VASKSTKEKAAIKNQPFMSVNWSYFWWWWYLQFDNY